MRLATDGVSRDASGDRRRESRGSGGSGVRGTSMPQITSFARHLEDAKTPPLSASSREPNANRASEPCDASVDVVVTRAARAGRDARLAAHEDARVEGEPLDFRAVRVVEW